MRRVYGQPDWDSGERPARGFGRARDMQDDPKVWRALRKAAEDRLAAQVAAAVPPPQLSRTGSILRSGIKGVVSPASILTDATIGSLAGAGSALAGYELSRPRSAGMFTAPGPGYEELFTTEDIDRISAAKQRRKEALRQQYIDEINNKYGFGTVGPGARIEEISEYLCPVDWPTGGWGQ